MKRILVRGSIVLGLLVAGTLLGRLASRTRDQDLSSPWSAPASNPVAKVPASTSAPALPIDAQRIASQLRELIDASPELKKSKFLALVELAKAHPELFLKVILDLSGDRQLRLQALAILGLTCKDGVTFLAVLKGVPDRQFQAEAARRIGEIGFSDAAGDLDLLARSPATDSWLFEIVLKSLGQVALEKASSVAKDVITAGADLGIQRKAAYFLADGAGEDTVRWMLRAWSSSLDVNPGSALGDRDFFLQALSTAPNSRFASLVGEFLRTERDPSKINRVVFFVSNADPATAVSLLSRIATEAELGSPLKSQAIIALARVPSPQAVDVLVRFIKEARTEEELHLLVQDGLARVPANVARPGVLEELYAGVQDASLKDAFAAVLAQQRGLSREIVRSLREQGRIALMREDAIGVRILCRLSSQHHEGVEDVLLVTAKFGSDPRVRDTIVDTMSRLPQDSRVREYLEAVAYGAQEALDARAAAFKYIARTGTPTEHQRLLALLKTGDPQLARRVAIACRMSENPSVISLAQEALATSGLQEAVRKELSVILGH